jgi:hypothetical protein
MDVRRMLLLAAVVCIGCAASLAQAQVQRQAQDVDPEAVATAMARATGPAKPWKHVRGFGRVLDLRNPPVVIDEPGLYAIDRNWRIPLATTAVVSELIQITAQFVTLDLHGFEIRAEVSAPPEATLLAITGNAAEIRNGSLRAGNEGGVAISVTGNIGTRFHHLSIFSHESMFFEGSTSFTDSIISLRVAFGLSSSSRLQRNTIICNRGVRCVTLVGNVSHVTDNRLTLFQGGGVEILGDRNTVANNVVDAHNSADASEAFDIQGDNNVVRNNTVVGQFHSRSIFLISGTANTLDGNIVAPPNPPDARTLNGMEFTADGNYYGDNRMAAQVPFLLGGTVQEDWGGNVGY